MDLKPEILLHPNIPKPLHGLNPRTILGQVWWDTERQKAYRRNNYHCHACGIHKSQAEYHKWLEAHECYKINYSDGYAKMTEIVALCHSCHNFIHSGRLKKLYESNKISSEKYKSIIIHGSKIIENISDYDENPYVINADSMAKWHEWRLILNGKEYFSKFKNYEDWEKFYSKGV